MRPWLIFHLHFKISKQRRFHGRNTRREIRIWLRKITTLRTSCVWWSVVVGCWRWKSPENVREWGLVGFEAFRRLAKLFISTQMQNPDSGFCLSFRDIPFRWKSFWGIRNFGIKDSPLVSNSRNVKRPLINRRFRKCIFILNALSPSRSNAVGAFSEAFLTSKWVYSWNRAPNLPSRSLDILIISCSRTV